MDIPGGDAVFTEDLVCGRDLLGFGRPDRRDLEVDGVCELIATVALGRTGRWRPIER